jgi:four helix bundle protein
LRDFERLEVWQKAHALVLDVYRLTEDFPAREIYGLTSQIRRSCMSIPTNIAEGCGRGSPAELGRCFQIARGSASELQYQLRLARDLSYMQESIYDRVAPEVTRVGKMLVSYRDTVLS